jgi:hypothetical protein
VQWIQLGHIRVYYLAFLNMVMKLFLHLSVEFLDALGHYDHSNKIQYSGLDYCPSPFFMLVPILKRFLSPFNVSMATCNFC